MYRRDRRARRARRVLRLAAEKRVDAFRAELSSKAHERKARGVFPRYEARLAAVEYESVRPPPCLSRRFRPSRDVNRRNQTRQIKPLRKRRRHGVIRTLRM